MTFCKVPTILANFAAIYILTSVIYLIITRPYGTPFKDAVQKYPELVKIKENSSKKRRNAFHIGLIISIIILRITRPFPYTC